MLKRKQIVWVVFAFIILLVIQKYAERRHQLNDVLSMARGLASTEYSAWYELLDPKKGKVSGEEFERIDFSLPEDSTYGHNPEMEFFNPSGRFKAIPPSHEYLDLITPPTDKRILFNVRRSKSKTLDNKVWVSEWIYAVVPLNTSCQPAEFDLVVPKDNKIVVDDAKFLMDCIATKDGARSYYFAPLAAHHYQE